MRAIQAVWLFLAAMVFAQPALADNITVYSSGSIAINDSRQLTAYVPLAPNTVTWTVNGIAGGDTTVGTVSASGLYQAPATIPPNNAVTVTATSTAYANKAGSVTLTITQMPVQLWSISPTTVTAGSSFTLRINGANLTSQSVIYVADQPVTTTFVSATSAKATATLPSAGSFAVKVTNPGLGGTTSSPVTLKVTVSSGTGTGTGTGTGSGGTTGGGTTPPPAIHVTLSPTLTTLAPSATQQFSAAVTGATDTSVVYSVNGVTGGNANVGTITTAGLYTAPSSTPSQPAVTIRATTNATPATSATATVNIVGPPNAGTSQGTANLAAGRFLEQATFGPTGNDIAHLQQIGIDAWLTEQFAMTPTAVPLPDHYYSSVVQQQYLNRLSSAPDQLRQRVANALSQFIVISMNKNIYPDEVVPYLQILSNDAFGNFRTLLGDITVSPQMGKYLDMANSNKPTGASGANENYAREMLQLFTIGTAKLNADGTPQQDAQGKTIATYTQTEIQQVALALTGWTYPGPQANNWEDFSGPMQPHDSNHDMRPKSFLGCSLPGGQTTVLDMNATLDCAFNHPNVGPFIATRLIRSMVTSNPTPAYVQRVAAVFNDNGSGVRGDLKAVVKAILTDSEARNDADVASAGRLRDPIGHMIAFVRVLNGSIPQSNGLSWQLSQMAQTPLTPPSVFSFYSPSYRIPKSSLVGPEFQIYTPTESVFRGNLFYEIITNPGTDFTVDMSPFTVAATDTVGLIDKIDQTLFYGRMPQAMRQSLANAIASQSGATAKAQTALYLAALSSFYAVQH